MCEVTGYGNIQIKDSRSSVFWAVRNMFPVHHLTPVFALVKTQCETDCLPSIEKVRQL